jgi:hypothetical protein
MVAVVVIDLSEGASFSYQQPVVAWVKEHFPLVVTLDVDAASAPGLLGYAQKLLHEARFCALFLKTGSKQPLGPATGLVEGMLRKGGAGAICQEGEQPQVASIFRARPAIAFYHSTQENDWQPFLARFLENSLKTDQDISE